MLKYSPAMISEDQITALCRGDRRALAQAITLVESTRADHRKEAGEMLGVLSQKTHDTIRLGITGTPGVGKSTFIEAFGTYLTSLGHKVAVLAVDPSSARTGGAILGDKTRMEKLASNPNAYIRPSPAGRTLGGVARRTREAILLTEAAGFDIVLVETVGVGQSETAVADMVDMFLLLLAPGGGDELQGIKRGIMELADLVIVNKADGALAGPARAAAADYAGALRLMWPRFSAWQPPVLQTSALTNTGIPEVWQAITRFRGILEPTGQITAKRAEQAKAWMWAEISESLTEQFKADPTIKAILAGTEPDVLSGKITPSAAASRLMALFRNPRNQT